MAQAPDLKRCSRCGTDQPHDAFTRDKTLRDGLRSYCRGCAAIARADYHERHREVEAERSRKWREAHPDQVRENNRRHYASDPEAVKARVKRWQADNPANVRAARQRAYAKNPQRGRDRAREWREANYERHRASVTQWQAANPEKTRELGRRSSANRKARKLSAFVEPVSELLALEIHDGVCGICGQDVDPLAFELDHILPLALGGPHCQANVQPSHPRCNRMKGARAHFSLS